MEYFWISSPNLSSQLVISVSNPNVSIITTNVSNIAVLLSHNVTCFPYFMPMSHGINEKTPTIVFHQPPSPPFWPGFNRVCSLFYKKYFINPYFALLRLLQKIMHFQSKTKFFISTYCWSVLILLFCVYVFLRALFHSSAIMKQRIASYLHICIASYLVSYQIMWHNKRVSCHCQL